MKIREMTCLLVLAGVSVLSGFGAAQENKDAELNKKADIPTSNNPVKAPGELDLKAAATGDMAEIKLGEMAQEKATDPRVKSFGQRMVKDHSTNDDQLKGVAQSQHIGLPTELDPPHKNIASALSKKSGAEFDRDYIRVMVQEHTKAVEKFKHEAAGSHDPTVKKFAQESLPVLESHLKAAQQIQAQLNAGAK